MSEDSGSRYNVGIGIVYIGPAFSLKWGECVS